MSGWDEDNTSLEVKILRLSVKDQETRSFIPESDVGEISLWDSVEMEDCPPICKARN